MRVALGQIDMVWEDKESSVLLAEKMIIEAKQSGADIIIFPEMSFTGFSMNLSKIGEYREESYTLNKMSEYAVRYNIAIGFGWAQCFRDCDKGANMFTVVDRDGSIVSEYRKIHPFTYGGESDIYEGGSDIANFSFMGHRISLFICYDLRFPEIFQIASRKSDMFMVIANWPAVRREHWETLLRARAIENQSYVIGVNCFGNRDNLEYSGDSMAVDALGNVIGKISDKAGVVVCDIDDRAWNLRDKFNVKADRREELYCSLYQKI